MGKPTGFLEFTRETPHKRAVEIRTRDYKEIDIDFSADKVQVQAARCMDCGTPFCHNGCPLGNIIPEFNDAVYASNWQQAYEILNSTNNFPEFTGRICPAPCESACVLGINKPPVAIEYIEKSIVEEAYRNGWIKPNLPTKRTNKLVAVVGSGPAGLAAAAQLNQAGHMVTVFERADQVGGLLRYGIPDFKLEKSTIDRRMKVMEQEGIVFRTNVNIGIDVSAKQLLDDFDLVLLTGGSTVPRLLNTTKGWGLKGLYPAMEFLSQQNKRVANIERIKDHKGDIYSNGEILATGKNVVVLGGGDTGSDCIGTSNRHGAKKITQIEILDKPELDEKKDKPWQMRDNSSPWPNWPKMVRTSTSHDEGCERLWSVNTKEFISDESDNLKAIRVADIKWIVQDGRMVMVEIENSEREIPCELALVAAGFLHPQHNGLLNDLKENHGLQFDERGNVQAHNYQTAIENVFVAGDMRRGQSLVVWAISEGREAARAADLYLMGETKLEAKAHSMFDIV